jgi:hypothetical protein
MAGFSYIERGTWTGEKKYILKTEREIMRVDSLRIFIIAVKQTKLYVNITTSF